MVGFQQPTEAFDAEDIAGVAFMLRIDDSANALMHTARVIIVEVLGNPPSSMKHDTLNITCLRDTHICTARLKKC